jgi:hypothetical protein
MNDTDAEARRLLTAATQDRPPGIDLLAGFAQARRDRGRRTWWRVGLSAGVAAAAAVTAAALITGSAPPVTGSASPEVAMVTSALTRTLAQSYHLSTHDSSYYIRNGQNTDPSQMTCTSEDDPVRQVEASACPGGFREIVVGGYLYTYVTAAAGHPGKHWWRVPRPSPDRIRSLALGGFTASSPQQMLSEIRKADKVTVVGPVSGPGWSGTRYAFSASPAVKVRLSGTLDVDQQGRARTLTLTMRTAFAVGDSFVTTQVLTFSDFGAPVTVTPPPADLTFSGLP